jgi:phosphatidylglycerol:prolipoprotein diacylglycerol transferase
MLALACIVSATLAAGRAQKQGLNPEAIFNTAFVVIIAGVIGARILYVVLNFREYGAHPREIFMVHHGGLAWFGALIGGSIGGFIYVKHKRMPLCEVLDLFAPFVALGQAIGRIGCLLNGCCYGKESLWGMYVPSIEKILFPSQVISSVCLLVIYCVLRLLQERTHRCGEIFYAYLALYGLKRFAIEFWRGDTPGLYHGFTIFHIFSIVLFFFALVQLLRIHTFKR